jgi:hypothetical protein
MTNVFAFGLVDNGVILNYNNVDGTFVGWNNDETFFDCNSDKVLLDCNSVERM